jgi:hypothetical protein
MARQNGQLTFQTPTFGTTTTLGDDLNSTSTKRIFTATERCTVVEVGALATGVTAPGVAVVFKAVYRPLGVAANDTVIPVFKAAFAAQGGVSGDPSVNGFDNANQIPSGLITNTAASWVLGKVIRAYCEQTLNKGDQIVLQVTTGGASGATAVFYAKAYCDGAGIVEACDVDSN